eukprot:7703633-Pyramimonas_sp.AAC.1
MIGVPNWVRWCRASAATETFGGIPYEATEPVRSVPKPARWRHASAGGNTDGVTKRVRGVPKRA